MISLHIPAPCNEKWEHMIPAEKGAFCHSCQKVVVDFSGMTDQEILLFFSSNKDHTCGRFKKSQLDRSLINDLPVVLSMDIPLWKKYIAILFACFSMFIISCKNEPDTYPLPDNTSTITDQLKTQSTSGDACIKDSALEDVQNYILGFVQPGPPRSEIFLDTSFNTLEKIFNYKE